MRILLLSLLLSFKSFSQTPGAGVTDVDGNYYNTVIIGTQEWMAENLRTSSYSNGVTIPNITDDIQWSNLTDGAFCYYNNDAVNNTTYGKLYNYHAVISPNSLCPNGWHIPTHSEWSELGIYLDPTAASAGGKMKSNSTLWISPNVGATNSSGFSALPAGFRNNAAPTTGIGVWSGLGTMAWFWSSDEVNLLSAYNRYLINVDDPLFYSADNKNDALSVRCVKSGTASIQEIELKKKELIKIIDITGRETSVKPNSILIYLYSDGTTEKVVIGE